MRMWFLSFLLGLSSSLLTCAAWPPHAILLAASTQVRQPMFAAAPKELPSTPDSVVRFLTISEYQGIKYAMVQNLSLPFAQAESYCSNNFPTKMHLLSVQSEAEWRMASRDFSGKQAEDFWLGGKAVRYAMGKIALQWLDSRGFTFSRFSTESLFTLHESLLNGGIGCLKGTLESSGKGNWSSEPQPCDIPHKFICKEKYDKPTFEQQSAVASGLFHHANYLNRFIESVLFPGISFRNLFQRPVGVISVPRQTIERSKQQGSSTIVQDVKHAQEKSNVRLKPVVWNAGIITSDEATTVPSNNLEPSSFPRESTTHEIRSHSSGTGPSVTLSTATISSPHHFTTTNDKSGLSTVQEIAPERGSFSTQVSSNVEESQVPQTTVVSLLKARAGREVTLLTNEATTLLPTSMAVDDKVSTSSPVSAVPIASQATEMSKEFPGKQLMHEVIPLTLESPMAQVVPYPYPMGHPAHQEPS